MVKNDYRSSEEHSNTDKRDGMEVGGHGGVVAFDVLDYYQLL